MILGYIIYDKYIYITIYRERYLVPMLFHLLRAVHPGWDPALVLHEGKGCPVPGGEGRRRVRHPQSTVPGEPPRNGWCMDIIFT